MANAVVGIDIITRLDQFRSEMAKIPDIGAKEAKALTAQLSKEIKAAERAATKAAASAKQVQPAMDKAAASTKRFGDAAGGLGQNAGKLAGILDTLIPGAGELARTVADVADAGEVAAASSEGFGLSLGSILSVAGPVLVAVGALALAYHHYKGELDAAEAKQKASLDVLKDVVTLTDQVAGAELRLAKALGGESKTLAEQTEIRQKWQVAGLAANETLKEQELLLREKLAAEMDALGGSYLNKEAIDATSQALESNLSQQRLNQQATQRGTELDLAASEAAELRSEADAHVAKNAADRAAGIAQAAKRQAEEEARLRAATEAARGYVAALTAIDSVGASAERSMMSAYDRLHDDALKRTREIEAAKQEAMTQAGAGGLDMEGAARVAEEKAAAARTAVWEDYYSDLDELRRKDSDSAAQAAEAAAQAAAQAVQEQLATVQQVGGYVQQGIGLMSDSLSESVEVAADSASRLQAQLAAGEETFTGAQKVELEKRIKAQKEAAKKAFQAAKAAKIAEAFAATSLAAINAIAQSPPPSPFGFIGAGIATAAGMASVAAIESQNPVFHVGGALDLAPDEMNITGRAGEYMLNPQGRSVLGDDTLKRANAGMGGGAQTVIAVSQYRHTRQVDRWKKDGLLAGDPIARAIQEGKLVGHRTNR